MVDIDPDLWKQLKNRVTGILGTLAVVVGLAGPLIRPDWVTPTVAILYLESVVLLLLLANLGIVLVHVSEERNLREWTLPLRRNSVNVEKKVLEVEIERDGPDHVEHHYEFTPAFDDPVPVFKALIGTDRPLTWDDLDVRVDGGTIEEGSYERRDWGDMTRFIFPIGFSAISGDDYKELTYSYDVDAFDPEKDAAFTVIRSLTRRAIIDVTFPDGWRPTEYNVHEGVGDDKEVLDAGAIDEIPRDGRWALRWECSNPSVEEYYTLQYKAAPVDDG